MSGNEITVMKEPPTELEKVDHLSIIKSAITQGADVGVIEKLVELSQKVDRDNARKAFFQAMQEFKRRCPIIQKDKQAESVTRSGAKFRIQYASPEQIASTVNPILNECDLSYSWSSEEKDGKIKVKCIVTHVLGHSETSEYAIILPSVQDMQKDANKHPAALGRAKRHSLILALGLMTTDNTDKYAERELEVITKKQVIEIKNLIVKADANLKSFLDFIGETEVEKIRASSYGIAKNSLLQRMKANGKEQE